MTLLLPVFKPAFYTHVISALLMLIGLVLFITNYRRFLRGDPIHLIMILLLGSISVAIHGHGHMMLEKMYGYDPLYQILN